MPPNGSSDHAFWTNSKVTLVIVPFVIGVNNSAISPFDRFDDRLARGSRFDRGRLGDTKSTKVPMLTLEVVCRKMNGSLTSSKVLFTFIASKITYSVPLAAFIEYRRYVRVGYHPSLSRLRVESDVKTIEPSTRAEVVPSEGTLS